MSALRRVNIIDAVYVSQQKRTIQKSLQIYKNAKTMAIKQKMATKHKLVIVCNKQSHQSIDGH